MIKDGFLEYAIRKAIMTKSNCKKCNTLKLGEAVAEPLNDRLTPLLAVFIENAIGRQ
jgi:hypothetical protein